MRKSLLFLTRTATALLLTLLTATTVWAADNPYPVKFTGKGGHWNVVLSYGSETATLSGTDAEVNGTTGKLSLTYDGQAYEPEVKVYYRRHTHDYDPFLEIPNDNNCRYTVEHVNTTDVPNQAKVIIKTIKTPKTNNKWEYFTLTGDDLTHFDDNPGYYQYYIEESETIEIYYTLASTPIDNLFEKNEDGEYLITCLEDWNKLAAYVADGNDCEGLTFKMTADVGTTEEPVTTMIGCVKKVDGSDVKMRFAGTFDGGNNTLTVALNSEAKAKYCAPFSYLQNATIKNLHVAGTVTTTGEFASGLVGSTGPDNNQTLGKCTIDHCQVSVELVSNYVISGSRYGNHGGFIGIAEGSATITNSWFDGKFSGSDYSYSAGFIGINKGKTTTLNNCLFNPQAFGDLNTIGSCEFVHNLNNGKSTLTAAYWVTHFGEPENAQGQKVVAELSEEIQNGEEDLSYYVITLTEVPDGNTYYIVKHNPTWEDVKAALEAGTDFHLTGTIEAGTEDLSIVISPAVIPSGVDVTLTLDGTLDRGIALGEAQANGYAIKVEEGATLTIIGGTITGGNNTGDGGGLYNEGTLNIIGTTITGNFTGGNGGGIYNKGTLNIDGATITGNQGKTENGRGIGIYVAEGSIFNVKGKVLIDGNCYTTYSPQQKKTPHNVYLAENEVISIAGALTTGSSIGVEGTDDVVASYADATEAVDENALPSIFTNDTQADVKAYNDGKNQQVRWNTDNKRLLTADGITVILPDEAPVYTGSAIGLEGIVVKDGEDVITEHCEFTYSNNVNAGTAKIIISAKEESETYIGSRTETFTIAQKEVTIKADDKKKTYGDDAPTFTASAEGLAAADTESVISCTFNREEGENVGEYTITPSNAKIMNGEKDVTANYNIISYVNGTLTVNQKAITITANNQTIAYGESIQQGTAYVTVANTDGSTTTAPLVGEQTLAAITLTASEGADVMTEGTITPSDATIMNGETDVTANYAITYADGTLTVTPITDLVTVTIVGANNTTTYDSDEHSVSGYSATTENELYDVTEDFTFTGTASAARTEPGTTFMELASEQFVNTNPNFTNVLFNVTDGYQTITSTKVTVTITGKTMETVYKNEYYTVWGYDVEIDNPLYLESYFSGPAQEEAYAGSKEEGTTPMINLNASLFTNNKPEEFDVTFVVKNGWLKIYYYEATLADGTDANNTKLIHDLCNPYKYGNIANVTLNRTFVKDGTWYTICLPFDVTIADSPLAGADVREMSEASYDGGTLTLNFTEEPIKKMEAGKAYLIKWPEGEALVNPVFKEAKFNEVEENEELIIENSFDLGNGKSITFKGTYAFKNFAEDDKSVLLVGEGNTLYYPLATASLGAQRAYFQLEGFEAGDPATADAPAFVLNFGDATVISNLNVEKISNEYFDLSGRRVEGQPTEAGIYIVNGKKVIVK